MTRAPLTLAIAVLVAIGASRPAHADDPPCAKEAAAVTKRDPSLKAPTSKKAQAHMDVAKRAYGLQNYDTAIDEYTQAGLDDDAPLILYDIAQVYRDAKEYEKAIRQYKLFIERGQPGEKLTALVECWISTMQGELDHAAATAPPTGPVADGGTPSGDPTPVRTNDPVAPPDHVDRGAAPSRWTGTRKIALGLAVLGVGGLVAGTVFGVQSADLRNEVDRLCPSSPCGNADQANALSDRADSKQTLATVSLGGGVALVAGAVILWFVGAPSPVTEDGDTALVPQIGPTTAGFAFVGTF